MTAPLPLSAGDKVYSVLNAATVDSTTLYIPIASPGRIKMIQGVVGAAVATANETFTLAYAPPASTTYTNVSGGTMVFNTSGSAAGKSVTTYIGPTATAYVADTGTLRITPSGGGTGAVAMVFNVVIGP